MRRLLALVPELPRLRLSSLDPAAIDDDLWRLIAEEPRLMPHLHLSLQAGSDLILKRMKRRHLRADARGGDRPRARRCGPGIAIGADLIAGFPTETEALFRETLDFVAEAGAAVPARVSLQRAARHAGGAHAGGAGAAAARTGGAAARRRAAATRGASWRRRSGARSSLLTESGDRRPFRAFRPGAACRAGRARAADRARASSARPSDALLAEAA